MTAPADPSAPDPAVGVGAPDTSSVPPQTITTLADTITGVGQPGSGAGSVAPDGAVLRYGTVTAIGTGHVQTGATGTAWIAYDASYTPTVGDLVYLLQQGPVAHVAGKLGGTQPTSPPVGVIHPYAGSVAPAGWLLCDGAAVSRSTYPALYAVCGTVYGAGDGSTTFNVPNLTDRVPTGSGSLYARGEKGGSETVTLSTSNMPSHTHGSGGGHSHAAGGGHTHASSAHAHGSGGSHLHAAGGGHTHASSAHAHGSGGSHLHASGGPHSHDAGSYSVLQSTVAGANILNRASTANTQGTTSGLAVGGTSGSTDPGSTASTDPGSTATTTPGITGATDPGATASTDPGSTATTTPGITGATDPGATASTDPGSTAAAGSGTAFNNMPPYLGVIFILRALP